MSYRVDGLEEVLTPDSFSTLNTKLLEDLNLKTGEIIAGNEKSGKIVNNFEGYIVTSLDSKKASEAQIGDSVTIRLSNSEEIQAKVAYMIEEEDTKLLVFKINEGLDNDTRHRRIEA